MEGQHFLKTGVLVSLSEQNILDCTAKYGNLGCGGGFTEYSFQYVIDNNGIDTDASYPYEGKNGPCRFNNETIGATISSFKDLPPGNEEARQKAVATVGPISVGVDALTFYKSKSGIFSDINCSPVDLNHGMLVVGYGTDPKTSQDYWIVRIAKNESNMCGIATEASYPIV